jgi:hypothetical protein
MNTPNFFYRIIVHLHTLFILKKNVLENVRLVTIINGTSNAKDPFGTIINLYILYNPKPH